MSSKLKMGVAFVGGAGCGIMIASALVARSERQRLQEVQEEQAFDAPATATASSSPVAAPQEEAKKKENKDTPSSLSQSQGPWPQENTPSTTQQHSEKPLAAAAARAEEEVEVVVQLNPEAVEYLSQLKQKVPLGTQARIGKYLQHAVVDGKRHLLVPILDVLEQQLDPQSLSEEIRHLDKGNGHSILCVACVLLKNPLPVIRKLVALAKKGINLEAPEGKMYGTMAAEKMKAAIIAAWVNAKDNENQRNVLHVAVIGQTAIAVRPDDDTDGGGNDNGRALITLDLVKFLVEECGGDYNAKDKSGATPLHAACGNNDLDGAVASEIVTYLVQAGGCSVNGSLTKGGMAVLHYAALLNNNVALVKTLVESLGANVEQLDGNGWTPFHAASFRTTNPEILRYLWSQAKDLPLYSTSSGVDVSCKAGTTPLCFAAQHNRNPEIVECLVNDLGADIKQRFEKIRGSTALLQAAGRNANPEVLQTLLTKCGASPTETDSDGWNVFHHAAMHNGTTAVLEFLCEGLGKENSALMYAKATSNGATALHFAVMVNQAGLPLVQYLVEAQLFSLSAKCSDGKTPLMWATDEDHPAPNSLIVRYLKAKENGGLA